jgi:hypothetical protein
VRDSAGGQLHAPEHKHLARAVGRKVRAPGARPRSASETTSRIFEALRLRFCDRYGYALVEEIEPPGTGRRFDALAVGLWPSRGCLLIGVEVKATEEDLRRELANPAKADGLYRRCDLWYLAVPAELEAQALGPTVPDSWGVLVLRGEKTLREVRKPRRHEALVDRYLLATLLRRHEDAEGTERRVREEKRYSDGYHQGQERAAREVAAAKEEAQELRLERHRFEQASGIVFARWEADVGQKLGAAVAALRGRKAAGAVGALRMTEGRLVEVLEAIRKAKEAIEAVTPGELEDIALQEREAP